MWFQRFNWQRNHHLGIRSRVQGRIYLFSWHRQNNFWAPLPCRVCVLLCPQEHFNPVMSCLVRGDSSGAGGSSCCGRGCHSSRLPPLSWKWKRLLRDPVRAPDVMSCPKEASASENSPGGLPDPVGCLVLSVWPWRIFLSCNVLSCLSSPGGLLIPPNFPREIFLGGRRVPAGVARPRDEATAMKTTCHGLLSSLLRHGLLSSLHRHGLLSSLHRHGLLSSLHCHGLQSSQLHHGLQTSQFRHGLRHLFRSWGPRPVVLSVSVLRGLQSAHPPSPVELLRRGTCLPGGGSYVRVLLCVSCVPASCVHIWFVSCPC